MFKTHENANCVFRGACVKSCECSECEINIPKSEQAATSPVESPFAGSVELPENTEELLTALHGEFYDGGLAHADAFRILPNVIASLKASGAIPQNKANNQN